MIFLDNSSKQRMNLSFLGHMNGERGGLLSNFFSSRQNRQSIVLEPHEPIVAPIPLNKIERATGSLCRGGYHL
jgi:hypothetical protein